MLMLMLMLGKHAQSSRWHGSEWGGLRRVFTQRLRSTINFDRILNYQQAPDHRCLHSAATASECGKHGLSWQGMKGSWGGTLSIVLLDTRNPPSRNH